MSHMWVKGRSDRGKRAPLEQDGKQRGFGLPPGGGVENVSGEAKGCRKTDEEATWGASEGEGLAALGPHHQTRGCCVRWGVWFPRAPHH